MTSIFPDAMTGLSDKEETRLGRGIPRRGLGNLSDHSQGPRVQGSKGAGLMDHANLSFLNQVWPP